MDNLDVIDKIEVDTVRPWATHLPGKLSERSADLFCSAVALGQTFVAHYHRITFDTVWSGYASFHCSTWRGSSHHAIERASSGQHCRSQALGSQSHRCILGCRQLA